MSTLTERVNGRYAISSVPKHTFRDSGVVVTLHKLGPLTNNEIIQAVRRELASDKPEPPMIEVDYGKGKIEQPHTGHPVYAERLAAWESRVNALANERLFKVACLVAVEVSIGEAERKQIADRKRLLRLTGGLDWQDDPELTEAENDQVFYISHIAIASPEDLKEFYQAIATRNGPSEAAVQAHKDSFPSDV